MRIPGINVTLGLNWSTLAVGAAAIFLAPMVIGLIGGLLRSATKTALKGGMLAYEKGKDIAADTREALSEIVEEAKTEVRAERAPKQLAAKK